jgi:Ca2+/Na+ antiporter
MSISEEELEYLFFYMRETSEEMRHVEQMRATVSSLVIALATLVAGFIIQQNFKDGTLILSAFVILLGLFGAVMTRKLYEIHQAGQARLDKWYGYLDGRISDSEVTKWKEEADQEHQKRFPLSRVPHNHFWFLFHMFISSGGVILLILTLR